VLLLLLERRWRLLAWRLLLLVLVLVVLLLLLLLALLLLLRGPVAGAPLLPLLLLQQLPSRLQCLPLLSALYVLCCGLWEAPD
jgi:hypothetical protein